MSQPKKSLKKRPSKPEVPQEDIMERFHKEKICTIIPTSPVKKKDLFAEYRPKSHRECMNYNISQTDTKMDAGPTKIHIQQTRVDYEPYPEGYIFEEDIPLPPPKKRKAPSHGRGPVWLFLDEELKRRIDFEQEIYKREMEARLKRKIKALRMKTRAEHAAMLQRVGPDWFQELSPDQMRAVDNLSQSINKDILMDTITNTQECLARLGLVLRPNHRHVEVSLKHCCHNPVEFLLILYQLMNPHRKSYSLNDRLLLSAVVHLSMRSVLREMHIRIPSPPPEPKQVHKRKKIRKPHIKYKSPYLVPYTFIPDPPKHSGIYSNQHIQYPESPYFSYLDELRREIARCMSHQPKGEEESGFRRRKTYFSDKTTEYSEAETLMSILDKEIDEELEVAQLKYDRLVKTKNLIKLLRPSVYNSCDKSATLFKYQKVAVEDQAEQYSKHYGGDATTSVTEEVYITEEYDDNLQTIDTTYEYTVNAEENSKQGSKFIFVGIAIGKNGVAIPIVGGVIPKKPMDCKCSRETTQNKNKKSITNGECHCEEKEREKEEREQQDKVKLKQEQCTCKSEEVIDTSTTTSISLSSMGSFVKRPIEEEEDGKEELLEVKRPKPFVCGCKEMVDIALECAEKKLESAADADTTKKKPTLIIADTKLDEDEKPLPIIAGIKSEAKCNCLEKYRQIIAKFEELKTRQEVQDTLKSCKKKFLISGVTTGPDGKPVYILSGMSQEKSCKKCEEMMEWKKREEERLANMPDSSQIAQKFVIGGVCHSPVGNVYILSGVLPTKDCECMRLYNAYMEKHAICMEIYEKYVQKMKKETEEYMSELTAHEEEQSAEKEPSAGKKSSSSSCECILSVADGAEMELTASESHSTFDDTSGCGEPYCECTENYSTDDDNDDNKDNNIGEGDESSVCEGKVPKRFIILNEIPCNPRKQMRIIKKVLHSMARDGFPLAKLPHAYKLPHFKLWMALRCGKYWTMDDRVHLYYLSKYYWHHLDKCTMHIKSPRLKMSNERAWTYTWASAKFIKKIANDLIEHHCRKAKQGIILDGREFFPSMFDYELPKETFRDCYFAYIPGKEESVFSMRPWKQFEFIDFKLIRRQIATKCPK